MFNWRRNRFQGRPEDRPQARCRIEALETRLMLTADASFTANSQIGIFPVPSNDTVPDGYQAMAHIDIAGVDDTHTRGPSGTITLHWYQGGVIATLPITLSHGADPNNSFLYPIVPTVPVTLNRKDAGTPLASGPDKGGYVFYWTYSGDDDFNPINGGGVGAYNRATNESQAFGELNQVIHFQGDQQTLVFQQTPQNAAVGDTIKPPITVAVIGSDGAIDTSSTANIALSLNPQNGATGALHGTLSEPAVHGVATFPDLSVDAPGTYTMTASNGSATQGFSPGFRISKDKLVFGNPPHDGSAGQPLDPGVTVRAVDASGALDTTASGTVTLSPLNLTADQPVLNNTAPIVNGVATFNSLTFAKAGFYKLRASDGADAEANSDPFKIAGDHLVFRQQPKDADANKPVPVQVVIEDAQGNVDTTVTSTAVLSLLPQSAGAAGQLAGTFSVPFTNGIANLSPQVTGPGTYKLLATEEDTSTGVLAPTNTSTPATSDPFTIASTHLAFRNLPAQVGVGESFNPPVQVVMLDPHNQLVNTNSDQVTVHFNSTNADFPGQADETVTLSNGVGVLPVQPDTSYTGILTITATDATTAPSGGTGGSGGGANPVQAAQATVQVLGGRLAFRNLPKSIDAGAPFQPAVQVVLLDLHNHPINTATDQVQVFAVRPGALGTLTSEYDVQLSRGVATLPLDKAPTFPGTLHLTADDQSTADFDPVTGAPLPNPVQGADASVQVLADHLAFRKVPQWVDVGTAIKPVQVMLVGTHGEVITTSNDKVEVLATVPGASGTLTKEYDVQLSGGVSSVALDKAPNLPGTIQLTAEDLSTQSRGAQGNSVNPVAGATASIQVLPNHLAFHFVPKAIGAGQSFNPGLQVAMMNAQHQVVTTSTDTVQVTIYPVNGDLVDATDEEVQLSGGVADVSLTKAPLQAGTLKIFANEVGQDDQNFPVAEAKASIQVLQDHLALRNVPSSAAAGARFSPPIQLALLDPFGKVVTGVAHHFDIGITYPGPHGPVKKWYYGLSLADGVLDVPLSNVPANPGTLSLVAMDDNGTYDDKGNLLPDLIQDASATVLIRKPAGHAR